MKKLETGVIADVNWIEKLLKRRKIFDIVAKVKKESDVKLLLLNLL